MAKMQRRFVQGKTYFVEGVSEKERKLKFFGSMKLGKNKQEYLIFRPLRKVSKFRSSN
jgi:hypothetical protein